MQVLPLSQVNAQATGLKAILYCISDPLSCCPHVSCIEISALTTGLYIQSLFLSGRFWFGLDTVVRKHGNAKKRSPTLHIWALRSLSTGLPWSLTCAVFWMFITLNTWSVHEFQLLCNTRQIEGPWTGLHFCAFITTSINRGVSSRLILILFNGKVTELFEEGTVLLLVCTYTDCT